MAVALRFFPFEVGVVPRALMISGTQKGPAERGPFKNVKKWQGKSRYFWTVLVRGKKKSRNRPRVSKSTCDTFRHSSRVFLNPWFGETVVCTLDSRGFRNFRGFRDFRESSTRLLVCSCLSCLWRSRRFRNFRCFRERRPARKP